MEASSVLVPPAMDVWVVMHLLVEACKRHLLIIEALWIVSHELLFSADKLDELVFLILLLAVVLVELKLALLRFSCQQL